mgnify:CR=1 FL=1
MNKLQARGISGLRGALVVGLVLTAAGLAASWVLRPMVAGAQTVRYVSQTGPCPGSPCYTTIQGAVDAASDGDIIRVLPGIYSQVNTSSQVVYIANKSITLEGDPSGTPTIAPAGPARGIVIDGGTVTLRNLKVTQGNASRLGGQGGGLYATGAQLTIEDCEFVSNRASDGQGQGGGAFIANSTVTIRGTKFIGNQAGQGSGDGGGLYLSNSTATIGASARGATIVQGNRAAVEQSGRGGGIFVAGGTVTIGDAELRDNIASQSSTGQGGGLYAEGANLTFTSGTRVVKNLAGQAGGGDGGGAYVAGGQVNIGAVVFQDNVASVGGPGRGGGLYLAATSGSVSGTIFRANLGSSVGQGQGGGAYVAGGAVTLTGTVFNANIASQGPAPGYGGGLFLTGSGVTVSGGTFTANYAARQGPGYGGAIAAQGAASQITGIEVRSNIATDYQDPATGVGTTGEGGGVCASGSSLTIRQLTVTGNTASVYGFGFGGGLAFREGSDGTVSASTITQNVASGGQNVAGLGGGIGLDSSATRIVANGITDNQAASQGNPNVLGQGGGIYLSSSPAEVRQNQILRNVAAASGAVGLGGGIYAVDSPALIEANLIQSNQASQGGGFVVTTRSLTGQGLQTFQTAGGVRLLRNQVLQNQATGSGGVTPIIGGGGIISRTSDFKLINNILARNAVAGAGTGMALWLGGTQAVPTSGSVYFNTLADHAPAPGNPLAAVVFLSDYVQGTNFVNNIWSEQAGFTGSYGIASGGTGVSVAVSYTLWNGFSGRRTFGGGITTSNDLTGDPKFVNPGALDYHIQSDSAAINQGTDVGVTVDIDGQPRPWAGGFDIGADEFVQVAARLFLPLIRSGAP